MYGLNSNEHERVLHTTQISRNGASLSDAIFLRKILLFYTVYNQYSKPPALDMVEEIYERARNEDKEHRKTGMQAEPWKRPLEKLLPDGERKAQKLRYIKIILKEREKSGGVSIYNKYIFGRGKEKNEKIQRKEKDQRYEIIRNNFSYQCIEFSWAELVFIYLSITQIPNHKEDAYKITFLKRSTPSLNPEFVFS